MDPKSIVRTCLVAATTLALCACGSSTPPVDRMGGETITLRFATIDDVNNNGQSYGPETYFESLGTVSGGHIKVELTEPYGDGAADAESRLVQAIADGSLDGGWPSTRAFANAGIKGLEAIEAPFAITTYAAAKALVSGPAADIALGALEGTGVVGLELAVGPLRRPFAAEGPLLSPDDWEGARFRAYNSPVQEATIKALGGTPVSVGFGWIDQVAAGELRGAEFDIAQYRASGMTAAGNVTSNVVLWPKVFVLSLSQKRFDAMSPEQQGWVRRAAELASTTSVESMYDESSIAQELCHKGARFFSASDEQVAALRQAVRPVIDQLAADPASAPLLAEVQSIAEAHAAVEVPYVPAECRIASTPLEGPELPTTVAPIPDGRYRVAVTPDEVEAAGFSNGGGWSGTWTLEIRDGTYLLYCQPLEAPGRDCGNAIFDGPFEAGYLRGTEDTVWLAYSPELLSPLNGCKLPASQVDGHCTPIPDVRLRWKIDGDQLTFSDPMGEAYNLILNPLTRIGG